MKQMEFGVDHYAISVSDVDKSIAFYKLFGFEVIKDYTADDHSVRIVQMSNHSMIVEFFQYTVHGDLPEFVESLGTDLAVVGSKHIGFHVDDLDAAAQYLVENGVLDKKPAINTGRLGRDYFFIKDPDGIFVEIISK